MNIMASIVNNSNNPTNIPIFNLQNLNLWNPLINVCTLLNWELMRLHLLKLSSNISNNIQMLCYPTNPLMCQNSQKEVLQPNQERVEDIRSSKDSSFTNNSEKNNEKQQIVTAKIKKSKKIQKVAGEQKKNKSKKSSVLLKNMIKNYSKKCAQFAIGKFSEDILKQYQLTQEEIIRFRAHIRSQIPMLINIHKFRELLLVERIDSEEIGKFKKIFQSISEIFIQNYSTNWILNSNKINDVKGHIWARFKILRRIRNPKHFTNLH